MARQCVAVGRITARSAPEITVSPEAPRQLQPEAKPDPAPRVPAQQQPAR